MVATRATCDRASVGAVITIDNQIISTGYNGSPSGMPHCDDVGHIIRDGHCIATIHAEINALLQCAKYGRSVNGGTMYVTHFPCHNCAKAIVTAGIKRLVYAVDYEPDEMAKLVLDSIECHKITRG